MLMLILINNLDLSITFWYWNYNSFIDIIFAWIIHTLHCLNCNIKDRFSPMDKETKTKDMENIPPPAYPGPPGNNGSLGYVGTSGLPAPPAYTSTYDEPVGSPPGYPSDPPPLYSPAPAIAPLGQKSTRLVCRHCSKEVNIRSKWQSKYILIRSSYVQVTTNVESKISRSGLTWAIICCLGGSWIASCLAFCLPGFRRYTHTCPNCG